MENSTKSTDESIIRIAVTSQNYRTVTKHAGLCRKLLVFNVQCSQDGDCAAAKIEEIEGDRIKLVKEMALNTCQFGVEHPIDIADVIISGSCGEGFIKKMAGRGIIASVTDETDPVEAVKEFIKNGEDHFTCDGSHQLKIKRHPNCPHNENNKYMHQHIYNNKGGCGGGHGHDHRLKGKEGRKCGYGGGRNGQK